MTFTFNQRSILPGFGLSLGFTILYLSLIVLIPLSATFLKTSSLTWAQFWHVVTAPRALASYRLSFGASAIAAFINLVFGLLVAWVLVRYSFPGRRLLDSLVDLPFALPTAVAGIALTAIYSTKGWVVFISGNMPMRTEITPLLIITKLEQYDYAGATAIAVVMLIVSFALLLTINLLQVWGGRREKTTPALEGPPIPVQAQA